MAGGALPRPGTKRSPTPLWKQRLGAVLFVVVMAVACAAAIAWGFILVEIRLG